MNMKETALRPNGQFSFTEEGEVRIVEKAGDQTREPWLMLLARRGQELTKTLCWGLTSTGSSFARIGTQEGDLVNGFVHEDPYKAAPLGQYAYFVDEDGSYTTNTWYPLCQAGQVLETTFGFGYVRYATSWKELSIETTCFVASHTDALVQIIRLRNTSARKRKLTMFNVVPVNIGDAKDIQISGFNSLMLGGAYVDRELNATVYRNNFGAAINDHEDDIKAMFGKVVVHTTSLDGSHFGTKYEDFVGHHSNGMVRPAALAPGHVLPDHDAEDGCSNLSSIQNEFVLEAGESRDVVVILAAASTHDYFNQGKQALKADLAVLKDPARCWQYLEAVKTEWQEQLGKLEIRVPGEEILGKSFRWLQYQCSMVALLNRMKSRFHAGNEYGFGFRDILQDLLALLPYDARPVRGILSWVAGQMFSDGSVYHNFYVSSKGNKSFVACDDPLWLVYAVAEYIKESGDRAFLDQVVDFADAKEGMAPREGSILAHLETAINRLWTHGEQGLPYLMMADWNDDLSDYEQHLSIMAAQQLHKALLDMAELLVACGKSTQKAGEYRVMAGTVKAEIDRRALQEDGTYIRALATVPGTKDLGSLKTDGFTFFEPIAWAGFSGVADKDQFASAKASCERLLDDRYGIPICQGDKTLAEGKIPVDYTAWKRSAPGKKENGGEFRHLESWYIASLCTFGYGKEAHDLYFKTLPAIASSHDPFTYAAERFVYPEYVSGPASREYGRAGHTWLTGTAPTRLGVMVDWIYGVRRTYDGLLVRPCVSPSWKEFHLVRTWRGSRFVFEFRNPQGLCQGTVRLSLDGKALEGNVIPASCADGKTHHVLVVME